MRQLPRESASERSGSITSDRSLSALFNGACRALLRSAGLTIGALALWLLAMPADAGVLLRGLEIDFSPFPVVLLPGERLEVGFTQGGTEPLVAPQKPGYYPREFRSPDGLSWVAQVFVMEPASAVVDGVLNGYRIGAPPPGHSRRAELYQPPAGFIEVREGMLGIQLSPHFTLGQFLCKQEIDYPKVPGVARITTRSAGGAVRRGPTARLSRHHFRCHQRLPNPVV
jgi:hypothetical protein